MEDIMKVVERIVAVVYSWFFVWRFNRWRKKNPQATVNWDGKDLSGRRLNRINLSGANLKQANLSGVQLRRANLSRAQLEQANLSGADLQQGRLQQANLTGANLTGANLLWARLDAAVLVRADLRGATLVSSRNVNAHARLGHANLQEAHLEHLELYCIDNWRNGIRGTDFRGAFLTGANLECSQFNSANFDHADLCGANISGTTFKNCSMCEADLSGTGRYVCPGSHTTFVNTDLTRTTFRNACLRQAHFGGKVNVKDADMSGADLRGINLHNSHLIQALHLETALLTAGGYQDLVALGYQPTSKSA